MLFAVGLNNTIKEKRFKKNVIEGFGKEIRDKISELVIEGKKEPIKLVNSSNII